MKNRKRILAGLLTAIMTISMLPSAAFASETVGNEPAAETAVVASEEYEVEPTVEEVPEAVTEETVAEDAVTEEPATEEALTEEAAEETTAPEEAAEPVPEEAEAEEAAEETVEAAAQTKTLKAKGDVYAVTVTYDALAEIPDDADIRVEEVFQDSKEYDYDDYVEQAAEAIDSEVKALNYIRLFDISIVDANGGKVEPKSAVDVQIRLKDVKQAEETTQVVHFGEESTEVINPDVEGNTLAFETEGFSIYAVLAPEEAGENARLKVIFKNGTEEIATMYVKKADVSNNKLNEVLYDPGVPASADGKKFLGWTDQTNIDLNTERMTINDVREDVKTKLNAGVKEGDEQVYNAIMLKAFILVYQDEFENTHKSESLLTMGDTASTTVDFDYTYKGADPNKGFLGWVVKGTEEPVYQNGEPITVSADTILVPLIGNGCWLVFYENDGEAGTGDASFTPPAFVPAGQTAAAYEPSTDPTWDGYEFAGWYDGPGDDASPFDFSKEYTLPEGETEIPVYAHWRPAAKATYKVIIWTQKVTDDKNAADSAKTYDYFETYSFEVDTGTEITQETIAQFTNYNDAHFGVTDLAHGSKAFKYRTYEIKNGTGVNKNCVKADDTTVVNVYYDRQLLKIIFNDDSGTNVDYVEVDHGYAASTVYGDINGQKVALQTNAVKGITFHTSYTGADSTSVGELATVYYRTTTSGNPDHTLTTANINLSNATVGTVYSYYNNTNNTLTNSYVSSSTTSYMYASSSNTNSSNRRYAKVYVKSVTYTYNGEPYTGQLYRQVNATVYTGLYGQSFEQNGYEWFMPDSTHPWNDVSYLNSFTGNLYGHSKVGGKANEITLNKSGSTTNFTIYYWVQDAENPSTYNSAGSARYTVGQDSGYNITERFQGMDSSGYRWTTTTSMPTTWNSVEVMNSTTDGIDSQGFTNIKRGSNTALHIRYDRVTNDIIYMYNDAEIGRDEDVPFEQSLESHEQNKPDESTLEIPENHYFAGWYEDPYGDVTVDWENGKMPLGNKTIYAVTKPVQYHVVIEMNGGTVPNNQSLNFWVNYGTILDGTNFNLATKSDSSGGVYSLLGYYLEDNTESDNRWRFGTKLTGQSLFLPYDGPLDPAREPYGDLELDPAGNNKWANTVGVFKLFAQWKMDDILSKGGLNIRYTNPEGAPEYEVVDPFHYADITDVVALQAPTEDKWPDKKRFDGWQLREDAVYQPAEVFVAESRDAVIEADGKYWITLTAVYVDKEEKTPTHITFYKNDGSGDSYITYEDVDINVGYQVYGLGEGQAANLVREGYEFLGWARDTETPVDAEGNPETDPETGDLVVNKTTAKKEADFLEYRDGKFYLPGTEIEVTEVAADEVLPYHGIYAIWKREQYHIYHSATGVIEDVDMPDGSTDDITAKVKPGKLYGGYYAYSKNGDQVVKGKAYTASGMTAFEPSAGETYYLKEVEPDYLKSVAYVVYNKNHDGLIMDLYAFVNIDADSEGKTDYTSCGFIMNPDTAPTEITSEKIALSYEVNKNAFSETINGERLGTKDSAIGYARIYDYVKADAAVQIRGFWITQDGIKVTGYKDRMIRFASKNDTYKSFFEDEEKSVCFTGWGSGTGQTKTGLKTVPEGSTKTDVYTNTDSGNTMVARSLAMIIAPSDDLEYTVKKIYGTTSDEQKVEEGDQTGKITYKNKSGYIFAGWYQDEKLTTPADFSDIREDMTVYAKYISKNNVTLSFTRKKNKTGTVTFDATVAVKNTKKFAEIGIVCDNDGKETSAILGKVSTTKTGTKKNPKYTYKFTGSVKVKGLSKKDNFTAAVYWVTPDGTRVTMDTSKCKYSNGAVKVQ